MQTNESKTTTTLREVFLLLASALIPLSAIVVTPSLPAMASFFSSIPNIETLVKLVITIPALAVVVGSPFVGMIIDRWGRRNLLIGALIIYGLSGTSGFFLKNCGGGNS
ncbi:MAG: MFS transporter [Candidatus Heimdallarchaeaceae archaeon]